VSIGLIATFRSDYVVRVIEQHSHFIYIFFSSLQQYIQKGHGLQRGDSPPCVRARGQGRAEEPLGAGVLPRPEQGRDKEPADANMEAGCTGG